MQKKIQEYIEPIEKDTIHEGVLLKLQGVTIKGKKTSFKTLSSIILAQYPYIQKVTKGENDVMNLYFESIDDLVDFNFGKEINLWTNKIFNINEEMSVENQIQKQGIIQKNLLKELSDQGFQVKKGQLKLKKLTSLQDIIKFQEVDECLDTTNYPTQTFIPLFQDFKENQIYECEEQNEVFVKNQNKMQCYVKPLFEGIVLTSILYGGYCFVRLFTK